MSSKKQLRQARRRKEREEKGKTRRNPAVLFIGVIVVALLAVGVFGFFFRGDRGQPPFPGAVWSEAHGHWH